MKQVLLFGILLIAFLLRVLYLDRFPVGFHADEVSNGYDAYSILKTGRDQWGTPFPLVLKSFGDYKSPVYSYLTVPSVAVFGLNKFAVRLPNAIIGSLAVLAVWLLIYEITKKKNIAFIASILVAVSPWHIMMSRGAFEANLITFFLPLGIYLYLTKKEILSSVILGIGLFTYHSAKLIIPVVFLALVLINRKKKILPIFIFSFLFLLMLYTFGLGGGTRVAERSIFNGALEEGARAKIELIQTGTNPLVARILHNKYQVVVKRFIANYKQYFSVKYLFVDGAGEATYGMIPGVGVIYVFEGILLLGLIPLLKEKRFRKVLLPLFLWLAVSPLPAALSTGVGYAGNRAEGMIPVIQILAAFGFIGYGILLKKMDGKICKTLIGLLLLVSLFEVGSFVKIYFTKQPLNVERGMLLGNIEAAGWLKTQQGSKNIIISRSFSEPQIFIAFANKWNPADYQEWTKNWAVVTWVDQIPEYNLANYTFKSIDWDEDGIKKDTLLVGRPEDFPKNLVPDKVFKYLDGTEAFYVKTN